MANLNANFTKFIGDDFSLIFEVDDAGNIETGYSAKWSVSEDNPDENPSTSPVITKESGVGTEIEFNENRVIVNIVKDDTLANTNYGSGPMPSGSYYHDCQLLTTGGTPIGGIIAAGSFTLRTPLNAR